MRPPITDKADGATRIAVRRHHATAKRLIGGFNNARFGFNDKTLGLFAKVRRSVADKHVECFFHDGENLKLGGEKVNPIFDFFHLEIVAPRIIKINLDKLVAHVFWKFENFGIIEFGNKLISIFDHFQNIRN